MSLIKLFNRDEYITFDFTTNTFFYGKNPDTDKSTPISEIGAIQVLSEYVEATKTIQNRDSDGKIYKRTVSDNHQKYETNLVTSDGSRLTLIDTREHSRAMDIAIALSEKLEVELWDYSAINTQ
jgi:hypothetical protein